MEDFSIPSFSLGLDIDIDIADLPTEGEEEEEEAERPPRQPCPDQRLEEEARLRESSMQELGQIGGQETLDEAQEEDLPPRLLKRLRRGPPPPPLAAAGASRPSVDGSDPTRESPPLATSYDDIEEFSSPEKDAMHCAVADDYPSTQTRIACSNTKFSLMHRGFLRDNSECKQRASKVTPASSGISTLTRLDASNDKDVFPRLTISPIRKINLIDSDSDDSFASKGKCRKNEETGAPLKKGKYFHEKGASWEAKKNLASKCQKESFWKDFSPMRNSKLETPALDEFCKEYFRSVKDQNVNQHKGEMKFSGFASSEGLDTDVLINGNDVLNSNNISGQVDINWDLSSPQPPAYQYFYHNDPRIQTLVRQRLPHFIPLGVKNNTEAQQFEAKNIDYINQFSPTFAGGKAHIVSEKVSRSSSSKRQNKESYCNAIEASDASGSWVNPRSKTTVPKDAGKRRVSADVRQSGHWFTEQDGRKVYVGKDGEKSTGRAAYRKYRKETGGFRKAKRKAAAKKSRKSWRRLSS